MPKNIEMNVKQQDGSYEVIYPKTVTENVYDENNNSLLEILKGIIVMWSGSQSNIPSGWVLCDGNNGTPDLRNRFIVGAGSVYSINSTGGEATHTLSVAEMPSHNHDQDLSGVSTSSSGDHVHTIGDLQVKLRVKGPNSYVQDYGVGSTWGHLSGSGSDYGLHIEYGKGDYVGLQDIQGQLSLSGAHTHALSGLASISNTGSSQPHNNLPPYYALCYIMKT